MLIFPKEITLQLIGSKRAPLTQLKIKEAAVHVGLSLPMVLLKLLIKFKKANYLTLQNNI